MDAPIPVSPHHAQVAKVTRMLHHALRQGQPLPTDLLQEANAYLESHLIELHAMPSPCPGQARPGSQGASLAQQNIIKAFRYGRHHPLPDPPADEPSRQLADLKQPKFDRIFAGGANRCLGPDTLIAGRRIADQVGQCPQIKALTDQGPMPAIANSVFVKGVQPCVRVFLANGYWFDCSLKHQVLTQNGLYRHVGDLLPRDAPKPASSRASARIHADAQTGRWTYEHAADPSAHAARLQGSLGDPLATKPAPCPSTHRGDDPRLNGIATGSQGGCPACPDCDGEQPLPVQESDQGEPPSPADARARKTAAGHAPPDGPGSTPAHNHPCQSSARPPSSDDQGHCEGRSAARGPRNADTISRSSADKHQGDRRPTAAYEAHLLSTREAAQHPLQSPEENGTTSIVAWVPLGDQPIYDFHVPAWNNYLCAGIVHHNSGKTVSVWGMCFCQHLRDHAKDGDLYWAIAPDFTKLRQGPHKWLWSYLPHEMFEGRSYSEKLGFGMNPIVELTLPGGRGHATVVFKTEEQKLESFESDSVHGIAWTEATRETIYDAILSRVVDTDGFILVDYLRDEAWHSDRFETNANAYYQHFCMADNAHNLPPGAIEKARRDMTADQAAVRIDGKNRAAFGVVIKEFRNEPYKRGNAESGHLVRPFGLPANWPKWVYTDVGKYTASLLLTVAPDGRWYVVDEAYTIGEMYDAHAKEIDAMLERNGLTREDVVGGRDGGHPWSMDPAAWNYSSTNEKNLGELYNEIGLPYQGWVRTATIGETAMLEYMRLQFLQFGLLVFDRCRHLRKELMSWKHKLDQDGKIDPKDRYTGHNHAIDALKAWCNSSPGYGRPDDIGEIYAQARQAGAEPWLDKTDTTDGDGVSDARDAPPSL